MNPDAVVIGAGPNGLVAANVLGDAGWRVLVLEANAEPGGAVKTADVTAPGFHSDLFSAFYPMTVASPVIMDLDLSRFGLEWTHAPNVLAHPRIGAPAAVVSRDINITAASLERSAVGDGDRYPQLFEQWCNVSTPLMGALLRPFPPVGNRRSTDPSTSLQRNPRTRTTGVDVGPAAERSNTDSRSPLAARAQSPQRLFDELAPSASRSNAASP